MMEEVPPHRSKNWKPIDTFAPLSGNYPTKDRRPSTSTSTQHPPVQAASFIELGRH
jgi:hypothetical protein